MTLTELSQKIYEADLRKYNKVPAHAVPRTRYSDASSNGLTKAIIDFIRLTGGHAERVANMGRVIRGRDGKRQYIPGTGSNGSADIHAMKDGRAVMIEVKIGRDRQSVKQEEYQARVEQAGGVYLVACSCESFIQDWIKIK